MTNVLARSIAAFSATAFTLSLEAALVAHYDFEEGAGSLAADSALIDGTPTPDDSGTISGAVHVPGVVGNFALSFDGNNDFVDLEPGGINNDILGSTSAATFATWVRLNAYPSDIGTIAFFSLPSSSLNSRGGIFISGSGFVEVAGRAADSDPFQSRLSSTALPLSEWVHLAGVLDYANEEVEIYFDGVLQPLAAGSINFSASSTPTTLSDASTLASTGGVFEYLNGTLDDVRIYNERLDGTQVAALVPEPSTTALIAVGVVCALKRRRGANKSLERTD